MCFDFLKGVRLQSATADGMSLPICALYGSPLMRLYSVMVLIAPLMLAQYFQSFHTESVLCRPLVCGARLAMFEVVFNE
jgi:hypothetical protein